MKKICIIGLGYIGLPTASMFASHGYKVVGVDVVKEVVEIINDGGIHIEEPGLKTLVSAAVRSGNLVASTKPEKADVFIIAVPTPAREDKRTGKKKSDLSYVRSATKSIVPYVKKGDLVILESTVPPRTVEDVMIPLLDKTSLKPGKDYSIAHSPERVFPGRILEELITNDRVVGGFDEQSALRTRRLYKTFVQGKIFITDSTTAEMVKLMENTYRDVNIALANEFALVAEKLGINIWEAIAIANHHPRVNIHCPGPGVGGHCIAVDPWFIIEKVPKLARKMLLARQINDGMPKIVVRKIKDLVKGIKKPVITILGMAFKANVDDVRESPALHIIRDLQRFSKDVRVFDPHVKKFDKGNLVSSLEEAVKGSDIVALITNHNELMRIDPLKIRKLMRNKKLFDARGSLDHKRWQEAGFEVSALGIAPEKIDS